MFTNPTQGVYATIIVLFVVLGVGFLAVRLPREAQRLEHEVSADAPPLRRRQLFNVGLVMFVSQALQVLVVSLAVAAFFVAFGLLAMPAGLIKLWAGQYDALITVLDVEVSVELLRVAGSIGALSGLYYAIATLTDETYRKEFLSDLTDEMRATFHDRAGYLRARAAI
jgi:hypothetical protein